MATIYLPQNLIVLRKANNYTQAEAATKLHLGRSTYANYEGGHTEPELLKILEIAAFYNISVDELLGAKLEIDSYLAGNSKKFGEENLTTNLTSNVTGNGQNLAGCNASARLSEDETEAEKTTLWLLLKEMREIRHSIDLIKEKVVSEEK